MSKARAHYAYLRRFGTLIIALFSSLTQHDFVKMCRNSYFFVADDLKGNKVLRKKTEEEEE